MENKRIRQIERELRNTMEVIDQAVMKLKFRLNHIPKVKKNYTTEERAKRAARMQAINTARKAGK